MAPSAFEPRLPWAEAVKNRIFAALVRLYKAAFARPAFYRMNRLLFNLSLRGLGIFVDEHENFRATGEAHFLRVLASFWQKAPIVFDVGAHSGEYADAVRCVAPTAAIYAFEPHPGAFARLERRAATYGYTAFNVGCGDRAGPATLYDYAGQDGTTLASLYPEVITGWWRAKAAAEVIEIIRLDDFIRSHRISRVDLIKIDTEGHEVRVLDGMEAAIAADLIDVLQIEFNVMSVYSRTFVRDLYTRLPQYRLYRMLPAGLVPLGSYSPVLCELFGFQNLVAVREGCGLTL